MSFHGGLLVCCWQSGGLRGAKQTLFESHGFCRAHGAYRSGCLGGIGNSLNAGLWGKARCGPSGQWYFRRVSFRLQLARAHAVPSFYQFAMGGAAV